MCLAGRGGSCLHAKSRIVLTALVALTAIPAALAATQAGEDCEWIPVSAAARSVLPETPTFPRLPPQPSGPCEGIRPGAHMDAPSGCTYNFVFEDAAGALYIGTAGHCVSRVGERVSATGVGEFGTVVFAVATDVGSDFGLVAIDADKYDQVTPAMCHWGGPTGMDPASAALGDGMKQYGHGLVLGQNDVTRARQGAVVVWEDAYWRAAMPVTGGDSGSPVILATGEAVGVVTHLSFSFSFPYHPESAASTSSGTRLTESIRLAEAATGLELTLLTAPLAG